MSWFKRQKIISLTLALTLLWQQTGFAQVLDLSQVVAQMMPERFLTETYRPEHLRAITLDPVSGDFTALIDNGTRSIHSRIALANQSIHNAGMNPRVPLDSDVPRPTSYVPQNEILFTYFLTGLTLPNDVFWVNLRPDGEDNIIDPELARTDLGKVMLEADLQLKKDTALLTSPESSEGRAYWDALYKKAREIFGGEPGTIPTMIRPWIVPDEIIIRQAGNEAYVYKATLKVLLEQDHLKGSSDYAFSDPRMRELNEYAAQLARAGIIPKLTREVNSAHRYASLRQVYYSLILAQWFKLASNGNREGYARLIDSHDLSGLSSRQTWNPNDYFKAYKKSFEEGEYRALIDHQTAQGPITRSYISGGMILAADPAATGMLVISADSPLAGRTEPLASSALSTAVRGNLAIQTDLRLPATGNLPAIIPAPLVEKLAPGVQTALAELSAGIDPKKLTDTEEIWLILAAKKLTEGSGTPQDVLKNWRDLMRMGTLSDYSETVRRILLIFLAVYLSRHSGDITDAGFDFSTYVCGGITEHWSMLTLELLAQIVENAEQLGIQLSDAQKGKIADRVFMVIDSFKMSNRANAAAYKHVVRVFAPYAHPTEINFLLVRGAQSTRMFRVAEHLRSLSPRLSRSDRSTETQQAVEAQPAAPDGQKEVFAAGIRLQLNELSRMRRTQPTNADKTAVRIIEAIFCLPFIAFQAASEWRQVGDALGDTFEQSSEQLSADQSQQELRERLTDFNQRKDTWLDRFADWIELMIIPENERDLKIVDMPRFIPHAIAAHPTLLEWIADLIERALIPENERDLKIVDMPRFIPRAATAHPVVLEWIQNLIERALIPEEERNLTLVQIMGRTRFVPRATDESESEAAAKITLWERISAWIDRVLTPENERDLTIVQMMGRTSFTPKTQHQPEQAPVTRAASPLTFAEAVAIFTRSASAQEMLVNARLLSLLNHQADSEPIDPVTHWSITDTVISFFFRPLDKAEKNLAYIRETVRVLDSIGIRHRFLNGFPYPSSPDLPDSPPWRSRAATMEAFDGIDPEATIAGFRAVDFFHGLVTGGVLTASQRAEIRQLAAKEPGFIRALFSTRGITRTSQYIERLAVAVNLAAAGIIPGDEPETVPPLRGAEINRQLLDAALRNTDISLRGRAVDIAERLVTMGLLDMSASSSIPDADAIIDAITKDLYRRSQRRASGPAWALVTDIVLAQRLKADLTRQPEKSAYIQVFAGDRVEVNTAQAPFNDIPFETADRYHSYAAAIFGAIRDNGGETEELLRLTQEWFNDLHRHLNLPGEENGEPIARLDAWFIAKERGGYPGNERVLAQILEAITPVIIHGSPRTLSEIDGIAKFYLLSMLEVAFASITGRESSLGDIVPIPDLPDEPAGTASGNAAADKVFADAAGVDRAADKAGRLFILTDRATSLAVSVPSFAVSEIQARMNYTQVPSAGRENSTVTVVSPGANTGDQAHWRILRGDPPETLMLIPASIEDIDAYLFELGFTPSYPPAPAPAAISRRPPADLKETARVLGGVFATFAAGAAAQLLGKAARVTDSLQTSLGSALTDRREYSEQIDALMHSATRTLTSASIAAAQREIDRIGSRAQNGDTDAAGALYSLAQKQEDSLYGHYAAGLLSQIDPAVFVNSRDWKILSLIAAAGNQGAVNALIAQAEKGTYRAYAALDDAVKKSVSAQITGRIKASLKQMQSSIYAQRHAVRLLSVLVLEYANTDALDALSALARDNDARARGMLLRIAGTLEISGTGENTSPGELNASIGAALKWVPLIEQWKKELSLAVNRAELLTVRAKIMALHPDTNGELPVIAQKWLGIKWSELLELYRERVTAVKKPVEVPFGGYDFFGDVLDDILGTKQPAGRRARASSAIEKPKETPGGIDFRMMPLPSGLPALPGMEDFRLDALDLGDIDRYDPEELWGQVQAMVDNGVVPSAEQIAACAKWICCGRGNGDTDDIGRLRACIARALRLQEERAEATDMLVKQVLCAIEHEGRG